MMLKWNCFRICFTIFLGLMVLLGCKEENKNMEVLKNLNGQKIFLPSINTIKNTIDKTNDNPLKKKLKIVTFIDGDCSLCFEEIAYWKEYIKTIDTSKIGIIIVVHAYNDLNDFDNYIRSKLNFNYPYFKDIGCKLLIKNNIPEEKLYKTYLLDKFEKVVLIGNPNIHEKIDRLYRKEFEKH